MWKVKFSAKAEKTLKRLDSITKRRIESFVDDLIITNNPRLLSVARRFKRFVALSCRRLSIGLPNQRRRIDCFGC